MRKAAVNKMASLVASNSRVVFLGSDLGDGVMKDAMSQFPDRVLMEGIAEQHIVGMAGGLALEGFIPYVHTIGTFLTRRCLEQVIVDVALHSLPVRLIANGGGMAYAPLGPTHQAIDDFSIMRAVPGMAVIAPIDPREMEEVISALALWSGPAYVRIGKGGEPVVTDRGFALGKLRVLKDGTDALVFTTGAIGHEVIRAAELLLTQKISIKVVHVPTVAPLDSEHVVDLVDGASPTFVVEEHLPDGGLWTAVVEAMMRAGSQHAIHQVSLPAGYARRYGSQADHWDAWGLSAGKLAERIAVEVIGVRHG